MQFYHWSNRTAFSSLEYRELWVTQEKPVCNCYACQVSERGNKRIEMPEKATRPPNSSYEKLCGEASFDTGMETMEERKRKCSQHYEIHR